MSAPSLVLSPAAEREATRTVAEFQSATAEILTEAPPTAARMTLVALLALVATALVLAVFLPIDKVVTSRGKVTSIAPKIVVQPLETSIVRAIAVRQGQVVKKGEVLATLDPTFSGADVAQLGRRIASLEAEIGRLRAELAGTPYEPPADTLDGGLQKRIQTMRAAQYAATLTSFDEKIAAVQAMRDRASRELAHFRERLQLTTEVETMRDTLQQKQVGSRLSAIVATDARVEIERNVTVQEGVIRTAAHSLQDLEAQRRSFVEKWASDTATEIVEKTRSLDDAREAFAKAAKRRDLVDLRAVEDALVLQVGDVSVGAVVETAQKIFTLVPIAGGVQVDLEIAAADQGFVKPGQAVELKLDAWRYTRHGTAHGVVRTVSADSFVREGAFGQPGATVFVAQVDITSTALREVPADFRLVPGMPLSAEVMVGSRTLAGYFLEKAVPMTTEGFREP